MARVAARICPYWEVDLVESQAFDCHALIMVHGCRQREEASASETMILGCVSRRYSGYRRSNEKRYEAPCGPMPWRRTLQ
ncbi:Protein of unknown function, partial [Gryllus bimaculatus]